jgi:CRP-like cAMP-binding protein
MAEVDDKPVAVVKLDLKRLGLAELVQNDALLASARLFKALGAAETARLLPLGTMRRIPPGGAAFREDSPGDSLFLVLAGEVVLSKGVASLATVAKGDFFGEGELLAKGKVRRSAATSLGGADVVEFPAAAVAPLVQKHFQVLALLRETQDARAKKNAELDDFLDRW